MMSDERAPDVPEPPKRIVKEHFHAEIHYGVEAIFDMGDYGLTEAEKIALGIHRLEFPEVVEEPKSEPKQQ